MFFFSLFLLTQTYLAAWFRSEQHGISSGYYLTFLMGGFATIAARHARSNIRPLLLLPPASASPSLLKRIYDVLGVLLSIFTLNYIAAPYVLLFTRESLLTWSRLGWYGHIVILGGFMLFYGGETRFLMSLRKAKGILYFRTKVGATQAAGGGMSVENGVSTHSA